MRRGLILVAVAALVSPLVAHATTMLAMSVDGLASGSDAVVRGKVISSTPRWTSDHARIITDTTIEVIEAWKGGETRKTIVVMQPGGEIGDVGQRVDGIASFTVGEELVLFLEARGERFTMAGMAQGRFKVETVDGVVHARQDQCHDLFLLDATTHQPVTHVPLSLPMHELKQRVAVAAPKDQAPATGTRVHP